VPGETSSWDYAINTQVDIGSKLMDTPSPEKVCIAESAERAPVVEAFLELLDHPKSEIQEAMQDSSW
jgi:hypothetical protein